MTDQVIDTSRPSAMDRYLAAETRLWQHYGMAPREGFAEIASPRARFRVLEAGSGPPVLFVHGTIGPAAWAPLLAHVPGIRALILDRPGWGLGDPVAFPRHGMRPFVADLLLGVLDALALDRVDLVGGSIGDAWVLSLAERHPDRIGRVVLLGGGPLVDAVRVPGMIRAIASPLGSVIVRLPISPSRLDAILRDSGHGASLDAGRIPDALREWRRSANNDTAAMRHERSLVQKVVGGSGWRPGITFDDAALQAIEAPVLLVYGTADPTGDAGIWRSFTTSLLSGSLELIDGAGHMPWFDEPARVGRLVELFLAGQAARSTSLRSAYPGRSRSAGPT
jgi:pimeloyl-ACP methyl ester carboxylesterase